MLTAQGVGSGVIYRSNGIILTNDHVVQGHATVEIAFADGRRVGGRVTAADPDTDLALVKVDRTGLPAATFRRTLPAVGSLAVVLGSPLGFDKSPCDRSAGLRHDHRRAGRLDGEPPRHAADDERFDRAEPPRTDDDERGFGLLGDLGEHRARVSEPELGRDLTARPELLRDLLEQVRAGSSEAVDDLQSVSLAAIPSSLCGIGGLTTWTRTSREAGRSASAAANRAAARAPAE